MQIMKNPKEQETQRRPRLKRTMNAFLIGILAGSLVLAIFPTFQAVADTVINVTTTEDELVVDGDCSLREAIVAANENMPIDNCASGTVGIDTIMIPPGTYQFTLKTAGEDHAQNGDLDINDHVILQGAGINLTFIDAEGSDRVFDVGPLAPGIGASFFDLTIEDGNMTGGAGVQIGNTGLLTLVNVRVRNNAGNGVYSDGAQVEIENSEIKNNTSNGIYTSMYVGPPVVTIENSTISGNTSTGIYADHVEMNVTGCTIENNWGGIVANGEILRLSGSSIVNNTVGLWISMEGFITNTTVSGNGPHDHGGGIRFEGPNRLMDVTNVTISDNQTYGHGGGVYVDGSDTYLKLSNVTITNNAADISDTDLAGGDGGGVYVSATGVLEMRNSLIAGNQDLSTEVLGNVEPDCSGTLTSYAYNLVGIQADHCTIIGNPTGNLIGSESEPLDPWLGPLQDNGGTTETHALLRPSWAVDAGNPSGCEDPIGTPITTDQRGQPREMGGACDIGAYESPFPGPYHASADFDADRTSDVVVFRSGAWRFFDYETAAFDHGVWTGTSPGCIPAPMDYDGDGGVEPTQLCDGAWHFYNDNGSYNKGIWTGGVAGDLPVPADYDGDGTEDVVVWRSGAWRFFDFTSASFDHGVWTGSPAHWLGGTNIPFPMDYDGDGAAEFTVWSGGPWHFYNDDGSYNKGIWTGGVAGDLPVPGDYDGDATEDVVAWRGGAWRFFDFSTGVFDYGVWTGAPPHWLGGTSLPAPVDYDGDGDLNFAVWSGGPWHFYDDAGVYVKGIWTGGVAGDLPISRRLLP